MPATEQTWRSPKLMHMVFGITSLTLLITTIWMLVVDHNRPWKQVQRQGNRLETRQIDARIAEQDNSDYAFEKKALELKLASTIRQTPPAAPVERFEIELLYERLQNSKPETAKELAAAYEAAKLDDASTESRAELLKKLQAAVSDDGDVKAIQAAFEATVKPTEDARAAAEAFKAASDELQQASARLDDAVNREAKLGKKDKDQTSSDVEKFRAAKADAATKKVDAQEKSLVADKSSMAARQSLFNLMKKQIDAAKQTELLAGRKLKTAKANFSESTANYNLAVRDDLSKERLKELQDIATSDSELVDKATVRSAEIKQYRVDLEQAYKEVAANEDAARKAYTASEERLTKLEKLRYERSLNAGKNLLTFPVLDAFNSPLSIVNDWYPDLRHKAYNFRETARFDRCRTCHQFIDKTAPGSAIAPGNEEERIVSVSLPTPPAPKGDQPATTDKEKLYELYGLMIAETGWLDPDEITVEVVWPLKPAAEAGLMAGDVIREINGAPIYERQKAIDLLTKEVKWNDSISLKVRRGVPQPFSSHPRLDLFVGSLSPHPLATMGCTACHEGQGSGTSFEYASHTPNNPREAEKWARTNGWFENHHWIYPMRPQRFQQSSCLKCHHDVVELEASAKFPDAPAPKVVEGYNLIRRYGCFGCHEINGFDGPTRRVGPDMRAEPNFTAAAQQIMFDPAIKKLAEGSKKEQQAAADLHKLADQLIAHPDDDTARRLLREKLLADSQAEEPALAASSRKLESVLKDVESPGKFRKVGPSLRHVGSKLDFAFLYDWIRNPNDFRPNTRMPRFFGLWDHLEGDSLKESQELEPIEIRASVEYLLANSQKLADLPAQKVELSASAERGKELFSTRGCLACHQAKDEGVPQGAAVFGPDLSRIGAKMMYNPDGEKGGQAWLQSWIRDPQRYHSRSLMPNLFLEPLDIVVPGQTAKQSSDPAADIAAYLMELTGVKEGGKKPVAWTVKDVPQRKPLTEAESGSLDKLAHLYLAEKMPEERAQRYLKNGIPAKQAAEAKGDESYLVVNESKKDETQQDRLLQYVGRRTIAKYGCAGCHDIPGFEDAKGIGTALADWGKKEPSKLAFEQIAEYLEHHGDMHAEAPEDAAPPAADKDAKPSAEPAGHVHGATAGEGRKPGFADRGNQDDAYFEEKLVGHQREGFIWQKLREPRSYDYKEAQNKKYNDRLRMPRFNLDSEQREAVITFILGLVADPPASQYVYHPDPRQAAVVEGSRLLEKFNCIGCHTLRTDRWDMDYKPSGEEQGDFKKYKPAADDYAFMLPHFTPKEIADSLKINREGLRHATFNGMTDRDEAMKEQWLTADGDLADDPQQADFRQLVLWQPTLIDGNTAQVGDKVKMPLHNRPIKHYGPFGGDFARLVWPYVLKNERATPAGKQQKAMEVLGWLPPPLMGEGRKVQSEWLYNFLQNPYPIRPAASLRMPRFNMSSTEATALVNYFSAVDGADYPYQKANEPKIMTVAAVKETKEAEGDWRQALNIVVDNNYCIKCHKVGDFSPQGSVRAMAPNLEHVHQRLRSDYVHPWLAKPSRILPYTPMPQNIAPNKPADQKLFPGSSQEQLEALVDLLMNYDRLTMEKFSVKPLIKPAAPAVDPNKPKPETDEKPDEGK